MAVRASGPGAGVQKPCAHRGNASVLPGENARSADFQSAVSRVSNPLTVRKAEACRLETGGTTSLETFANVGGNRDPVVPLSCTPAPVVVEIFRARNSLELRLYPRCRLRKNQSAVRSSSPPG